MSANTQPYNVKQLASGFVIVVAILTVAALAANTVAGR